MTMQVGGLKSKVFSGISWLAFARVSNQVFSFITIAILARLLLPTQFGLVGIAILATSFLNIFNKFGISAAIIQRRDINENLLSSVFWPNIVLGVLLSGSAFLLSGGIADFFGEPNAQSIISILALSLTINSFGIVQESLLRRDLKFKIVSIAGMAGSLCYGLVSVICALLGLGVWALVAGNLARSAVSSAIFWFSASWRPSFRFDWEYVKEVYSFGFKIMLGGIVDFFRSSSDYAFIGKVLGPYSLGIYTLSFNMSTLAHSKITTAVRDTLIPAYSRIQDDHRRLRDAATEAAHYLALIVFPVSLGLAAVAPEFVRVVFGAKWEASILPAQILLVGGALLAVNPIIGSILIAVGRPGVFTAYNAIKTAFLVGAIYVGLKLGGIVGVAWAVTLTTIVPSPFLHVLAFHYIKGNVWRLWKGLGVTALISILMALGVLGVRSFLVNVVSSQFLLLAYEVVFGIVLYLILMLVVRPPAWSGVLGLATPILKNVRKSFIEVISLIRK